MEVVDGARSKRVSNVLFRSKDTVASNMALWPLAVHVKVTWKAATVVGTFPINNFEVSILTHSAFVYQWIFGNEFCHVYKIIRFA